MLADRILEFLAKLDLSVRLPAGVGVLNPYRQPAVMDLCNKFYRKYYSDNESRVLILGINPGRFGGGVTGIPFTDPIRLDMNCGISNTLARKPELSSDFIYQMIMAYGGPEKFYGKFYISSVSPLGFVKDGKNLNYYDIPALAQDILPFISGSLKTQLAFGIRQDVCYCLGEGDNFKYVTRLNAEHHFFTKIMPLSHPRFVLQYRRKKTAEYIADYLTKFRIAE